MINNKPEGKNQLNLNNLLREKGLKRGLEKVMKELERNLGFQEVGFCYHWLRFTTFLWQLD